MDAQVLKKSMSQKLRMDGRDYSTPGWYFITLGADYHNHFFGHVEECVMQPNELGNLVDRCWAEIPQHYGYIELGAWQLMPNHFHGLVRIVRPGGKSIGEVINVFKGAVTREWRRYIADHPVDSRYSEREPFQVWAPNYYDVICFNAKELEIRERYVQANPRRWALQSVPQGKFQHSLYRGNIALLESSEPYKALRVARRESEAEIAQLQSEFTKFNGLVCSTFFSPGERKCLTTLLSGSAQIIWVLPMGIPKSIPVGWTDAFLENRALWISLFPENMTDATRASCEQANYQVEQFCRERKGVTQR